MKIPKIAPYAVILFCVAAVIAITLRSLPFDYLGYINYTRDWLAGKTQLYDANYFWFIYTPWTLLIFIPFSFLPPIAGMLLYNLISLLLVFWVARHYAPGAPWWAYTIALFNIYLVLYFQLGQFDILILCALVLASLAIQEHRPWLLGISLVLVSMKPTNVILPLLILLLYLRKWPLKDIGRALLLPAVAFGSSFLIAGSNWISRYIKVVTATSQVVREVPVITIFGKATYKISYWDYFSPAGKVIFAVFVGLAVYFLARKVLTSLNQGLQEPNLFYALAINLVVSPWVLLYHFVYLAPVITRSLTVNRTAGLLLILATIIDLGLCLLGVGFSGFIFVVLILFMLEYAGYPRRLKLAISA